MSGGERLVGHNSHSGAGNAETGRSSRCGLHAVCALVLLAIVAPASGQGQTPSSPRSRPTTGYGYDYDNRPPLPEDGRPTSGRRSATGRFEDRRSSTDERPSEAGQPQQPGEKPAEENKPAPEPPGPRKEGEKPAEAGGGGPKVIGGGGRGAAAAPGAAGTTPPGAPGLPSMPGAATGPISPGGIGPGVGGGPATAVNVMGQGTYEPAFEHDVEYPDVPDAGAENLLTEEGPMTVIEFLSLIHLATDWNIISTEEANKVNLNFYIVETTPKQALKILEKHKIYYEWDDANKYLYVMTENEHLAEMYAEVSPQPTEFPVKFADVTYVESLLSSLLSQVGRIVTDQRTNLIYVWDTPDNLAQMEKTFAAVDVPLQKREFTVQFADLADIESTVSSLLSPNGSLLSDPRTGQLFVWDNPAVLDKAAETVARLDVPVQPVTYEIKYVNAEDMTDSLEPLLSERGLIQVDPRYNTLVVTDLPNRQERIGELIATLDRELETKTWVINYADLDFVADQIEAYVPSEMGEIVVNDLVHQVTVTGLPERLAKIDELIKVWDVKRRQVMIEAFLVDVGESAARDFNIRWSYFDDSNGSPVAINSPTGGFPGVNQDIITVGQLPYSIPLYGDLQLNDAGEITRPVLEDISGNTLIDRYAGNKLAVALSYLDKTTDTTLLAAPRVTVQDGEEAIFENAERVPYASSSTSYGGGYYGGYGGYGYSQVEFIDVGIILRVKPVITENGDILLDIAAEDSSAELVEIETFQPSGTDTGTTSRKAPQVKARNVETQMRVNSGDTVVLGGLRQSKALEDVDRVPVLGDIPLLGRLFKYPSKESASSTLMMFLTPTIVDEGTFPESEILSKADRKIAESHRHNRKDFFGRMEDRISKGQNEIGVSVGQGGHIHSEGQRVTLDELRDALFKVKEPKTVILVIRKHPRAPEDVVSKITEMAMEADVKFEFDAAIMPIVPAFPDEPAAAAPRVEATPVPPPETPPAEAPAAP